MKKLWILIFTAVVLSMPVFGQVYSDIRKIDSLMKKPSDSSLRQLSDIILPYFIKGAGIDEVKLKSYLPDDVTAKVVEYLNYKQKDLKAIQDLTKTEKGKVLIPFFTKISSALEKLNSLKKELRDKGLTELSLPANAFDMSNVPARYDDPKFITNLNTLITAVQITPDSVQKMSELVKATYAETKETLKKELKINNNDPIAIKDNIDSLNAYMKVISDAKASIFSKIEEDKELKKELVSKTPNNLRQPDSYSLKNFPVQNFVVQPSAAQAASLSLFKMPTQSEMIESLAIFISKRVGQEVTMSFMEVLKKRAKTVELVSVMFPGTVKLLQESGAYEVPKLGSVWHYAISQDLQDLPLNLANSEYIKYKLKNNPNLELFNDVVKIGNLAKEGNSLPEICLLVDRNSNLYPLKDSTMIMGFELLNLINQELSSAGGYSRSKSFWINWTELNSFNSRDWDFFIKFIALKYNTKIFNSKGFNIPLDNFSDPKWQSFKTIILKSLILLNQFQDRRLASLQNIEASSKIKAMSFWECQQALFELLLNNELITEKTKVGKSLALINKGMRVYKLQEQGNYAAMLRESVDLINQFMPKQSTRINELFLRSWKVGNLKYKQTVDSLNFRLEPLNELYQNLISAQANHIAILKTFAIKQKINFGGAISEKDLVKTISVEYMKKLKSDHGDLVLAVRDPKGIAQVLSIAMGKKNPNFAVDSIRPNHNLTIVLKTAEFFTDVMSAGNSEQLAQVVEAYAMPPGSYKVKRNTRYSIDLDAYVGLYGGVEFLNNFKTNNAAPLWGLSAPIGLSFTWGGRNETLKDEVASFLTKNGNPKTLNGNSFTLGLSVIDIAAPLAFRLSGDDQGALPKSVTWAQIFSPGVHARWGIKNTPLCISTGLQYTPQLRKVEQTSKSEEAFRVYAGLFFDLPLFNIYRR